MRAVFCLPVLVLGLNACTAANWYQGVREAGRQQCRQDPDRAAQQACLDKLDGPAGSERRDQYESYNRARQSPAGDQ